MAVRRTETIDSSGATIVEERDVDTNALLRRFRAQADVQPLKVRLEEEMAERYGDWLRWKTTRVEAQARGVAAVVITALTNRENAAWAQYATAIQEWRTA